MTLSTRRSLTPGQLRPIPSCVLRFISRFWAVHDHNGVRVQAYPAKSWYIVPFPHAKGIPFVADNLATANSFVVRENKSFAGALSAAEKRWSGSPTTRDISWRLHIALWAARLASQLNPGGDFLELGTGKGFIAAGICAHIRLENQKPPPRFFLVDRFMQSNNPVFSYTDDMNEVANFFASYGEVQIVEGDAPQCLSNLGGNTLAFVHIDLNDASAEIASLEHLTSRFTSGTVLLFDDTGQPGREEQLLAHLAFADRLERSLLLLPTGQSLIIV